MSFLPFLSENKCYLLFQSLIESPGDLTKDDFADDLEWPLKVMHYKQFRCLYLKTQHMPYHECRVLSLSDRRYSLNPLSQTRID